jgi:hypothetical protein
MADSKITALDNLTAADPVNDMFPIVDVSDTTMAASGTTKRISVNNILGASGTATLASAAITGDLTVDTSTLKVDSTNNRVGIGTATPIVTLDVVGAARFVAVATGPKLSIENAGGATRFLSTDTGSFYYSAYDHNFTNTAGTVDRLVISNAGNVTVSTGNVVMATSGKGIDFSATTSGSGTMTSELLNDYEEGTFTPSIGGTATYTAQTGTYTKVGRLVTASFDITILLRGTGDIATVSGLPFAASANVGAAVAVSYFSGLANSSASIYGYVNTSAMAFNTIAAGGGTSPSGAVVITNGTRLAGTAVYMV